MEVSINNPNKAKKEEMTIYSSNIISLATESFDKEIQPTRGQKYNPIWQRLKRKILMKIRLEKAFPLRKPFKNQTSSKEIKDENIKKYLKQKNLKFKCDSEVKPNSSTNTLNPGSKFIKI